MNKRKKEYMCLLLGVIVTVIMFTCLVNSIDYVFPCFSVEEEIEYMEGEIIFCNHVESSDEGYKVVGNDAYIIYKVGIENCRGIELQFDDDFQHNVYIQVFYAGEDGAFLEEKSVRATLRSGEDEVIIPVELENIDYIRLDVEVSQGEYFDINNIFLDTLNFDFIYIILYLMVMGTVVSIIIISFNKKARKMELIDESNNVKLKITIYNLLYICCIFMISSVLSRTIRDLLLLCSEYDDILINKLFNPIVIFIILSVINILFYEQIVKFQSFLCKDTSVKKMVIAFYLLLLVAFFVQMRHFVKYAGHFPDEIQHISYIAYLKSTHKIIPEFENMNILLGSRIDSGISISKFGNMNNYLGHPPLYYWVMQLAGGIDIEGTNVIVNVDKLRNFNQFIAISGVISSMYIGLTRIKRPLLQCLYGLLLISLPGLTYGCAGINNDTLTVLVISIFALGLIRFYENKIDWCTFYLVASGLTLGLLTKMTVGAIMVFSIILTVVYTYIKERNLKSIFNRYFLSTIWMYGLVLIYFIVVYIRYGTIQPSLKIINYEQFVSSGFLNEGGTVYPIKEYLDYFISSLRVTWLSIVGNGFSVIRSNNIPFYQIEVFGLLSIVIIAILGLLISNKQNSYSVATKIVVLGVICAILYHFVSNYKSHLTSAYLGACSSRYYYCCISLLALMVCSLFDKICDVFKKNKIILGVVTIAIGIMALMLIYDSQIYIYMYV